MVLADEHSTRTAVSVDRLFLKQLPSKLALLSRGDPMVFASRVVTHTVDCTWYSHFFHPATKLVIIPVSFRKIPYYTQYKYYTQYSTGSTGISISRRKVLQNTFKILILPKDTPEY